MRWQKELEDGLAYKQAIILCGNIRDKYLYLPPHAEREYELLTLKDYLRRELGRRATALRFYDPIAKITDDSLSVVSSRASGASVQSPAANDLDETTPERRNPSKESNVDRDLGTIQRQLITQEQLWYVVQYADKTAPDKALNPEDMKLILRLEKIIENLRPTNKLILIYLFVEQIPKELYQQHPKTKLIEIPTPDRSDLKTLFKDYYRRLDDDVERAVNSADGLRLLEIEQIVNALKEGFQIDAFEQRVRAYKFGEQRNYWAEISLKKLDAAADYFKITKGIQGQEKAIARVIQVIVRARADIQRKTGGNPKSPRGVLFFAGPTGVGKTLTAKTLAEFLFGTPDALVRFDMSEYHNDFQVTRLYGAPPGYVGYESGGVLTNAMRARPFAVLLFDEIEKAHPRVFDVFLQILSDGRLTDSRGDVVFFSEAIIIFTSNLGTRTSDTKGHSINERSQLDELIHNNDQAGLEHHFVNAVEDFFQYEISRPELLNRIGRDNIITFQHITAEATMRGMLQHYLTQVQNEFNDSFGAGTPHLQLSIALDRVSDFLYQTYRSRIVKFGGREVEHVINERIRDQLAQAILQVEHDRRATATIHVELVNGQLEFTLQ